MWGITLESTELRKSSYTDNFTSEESSSTSMTKNNKTHAQRENQDSRT